VTLQEINEEIAVTSTTEVIELIKLNRQKFKLQFNLVATVEKNRLQKVQQHALESGMVQRLTQKMHVMEEEECPVHFTTL